MNRRQMIAAALAASGVGTQSIKSGGTSTVSVRCWTGMDAGTVTSVRRGRKASIVEKN